MWQSKFLSTIVHYTVTAGNPLPPMAPRLEEAMAKIDIEVCSVDLMLHASHCTLKNGDCTLHTAH